MTFIQCILINHSFVAFFWLNQSCTMANKICVMTCMPTLCGLKT